MDERRKRRLKKVETDQLKAQFISELKSKYKLFVDAVYPIPFIAARVRLSSALFIEGGIDFLEGSWKTLDSHHVIFKQIHTRGARLVIEGGPGFGKSTLALQFVSDWCKLVKESFLCKVEILVFLRLRQLAGVKSVYAAIERFILPSNTSIQEEHIKQILEASRSVVIILDGYDEYLEKENEENLGVTKIMMKDSLKKYIVILTGRSVPVKSLSNSYRFQLTGFNTKAREEYIIQTKATKDRRGAQKVLSKLYKNSVLNDLCEVPLFFVMFAHMYLEYEEFKTLTTLTSFFQFAMDVIYNHAKIKMNDENVQTQTFLEDHDYLDRIAFDGFIGDKNGSTWKKEELLLKLPESFYDQYVNVGILVEEVWENGKDEPWIEVRFFHRLFQEWYAANYVAGYAKESRIPALASILKPIATRDFKYLYRFACGIDLQAAKAIIEYLKKNDKWLAALCYQEQTHLGGIDDDFLADMCSTSVVQIEKDYSKLFQKNIVQLLNRASISEISIAAVWLIDCFNSLVLPETHHRSSAEPFLPALETLKELRIIWTSYKVMTHEDARKAFEYASTCSKLEHLGFSHCLLPRSFRSRSLRQVRLTKIQVEWNPAVGVSYFLNFETGNWEDIKTGKKITNEDYKTQERVRYLSVE